MKNKFEQAICPVCGEYEFVDDTDLEKEDSNYEGYQGDQCSHCGWIYDIEQLHNHDLKEGNNKLSVNEYKEWFAQKISENPNFDFNSSSYQATPHKCPVCGKHQFSDVASFEICPFCGWEDDDLMEAEPDKWAGNSNDLCLNDFIKRYQEYISKDPQYKYQNK